MTARQRYDVMAREVNNRADGCDYILHIEIIEFGSINAQVHIYIYVHSNVLYVTIYLYRIHIYV